MEEEKKQFGQIKIAILSLLVCLFLMVLSFAVILQTEHEDDLSKDLKISLLIDEIGTLREENDILYTQFKDRSTELITIYGQLNSMNKKIIYLNNDLIEKKELAATFNTTQEKLYEIIGDKDSSINQLVAFNNQLNNEIKLPKYTDETVHILILGQNSGLLDTIILASINPINKTTTLVSLPRDLYFRGRKINELYKMYGIEEFESAIYEITKINPDKYVIFDFKSFISIVDFLGGIDINVEKDLIDYQYPGPNHTYSGVTFRKGLHHMDGNTALKYARSRKSTSDFDRSKRQQQIINSVKQSVLDLNLIYQLDLATKIYALIKDNIITDTSFFEALAYLQSYQEYDIEANNIISNQNFLYSSYNSKGQYILLPHDKSFSQIRQYFYELINF